jgi:hypothetical protein
MTPLGEAAIRLSAKGLRVFPCWPRKKEPAIRDNLRLAAVDVASIRRFWGEQGSYNIGVKTGRDSGIWVTDEDGEEGLATMSRLEAEHGKLPKTVEVVTGGGGRHLYWRWPSNGVEIRNWQVRDDLPGLDVRGEGGYVLAPPSIHPSGRAYAWSVDSADAFSDAPDWLIRIATERSSRKSGNGQAAAPSPPEAWRALIDADHEGSHRSSAVARLYGHFVRRNVDAVLALHFAFMFDGARNKPPLGHGEVRRICDDIADLEAQRRRSRE